MRKFASSLFAPALCALMLCFSACNTAPEQSDLLSLVNPMIGTGGHGHTYPGATLPFGMVQLSPDTRLSGWDGCGGYHDTDSLLFGFSHTHLQGTGVSDYGDVLLMPTGKSARFSNDSLNGYPAFFDKASEKASPGYYSVRFGETDIQAELTVTPRTGIHRYTFTDGGKQHLSIDLKHRDKVIDAGFEQVNATTVRGFRLSEEWAKEQHVYFYATFSSPILEILPDNDSLPRVFSLVFEPGTELVVKVGISAVDMEGAAGNLLAETGEDFEFDRFKKEAESRWIEELSRITVQGGSREEQVVFYTSLYHSFTVPNLFMDADGRYRSTDLKVHKAEGFTPHTVFSLWDTFRATHPLYTLVQRERTLDFIHTFLDHYQHGGKLPMWELAGNYTGCMIGYHAVPVIVDAWEKGIRDFDGELALEAMVSTANTDELGKAAFARYAYIPMEEEHESVSKALEYAYNDWCIARFAQALGKDSLADVFYQRAQHYKNHFDPESGFMRARINGGFLQPFNPSEVNFNYTEANSWQYSFFAPHDISGLIALHGGDDAFNAKLDELFNTSSELAGRGQPDITGMIGQYAHGNEPSHHMAFLYHYSGQAWKSQELTQRILAEQYRNAPDGLSGNEDCGQMSSWYVLAAMGLYPVCPGTDEYVLSTPLFQEVTLHLENSNTFTITCNSEGKYIQSVQLNGNQLDRLYLTQAEILAGGKLELVLSDSANYDLGKDPQHRPHSAIAGIDIPVLPVVTAESRSFTDTLSVRMYSADPEAAIFFRRDGTQEVESYSAPIRIDRSSTFTCWTESENGKSGELIAEFVKRDANRKILSIAPYDPQYAAGGDAALIDGLRGGNDFRTGFWQGFYGKDFEALVDLGEMRSISQLSVGFLQDVKPWIWYPEKVVFSVSTDGVSFREAGVARSEVPVDDYTPQIRDFGISWSGKARYVKVFAPGRGIIPDWHLGAGNPSWLFADEIVIR